MRQFGFSLTLLLSLFGVWPLFGGGEPRWWLLGLASAVLLAAWLRPGLLSPAHRLLRAFGERMSRLVAAAIYLTVFGTLGALMRLSGRDALRLRWDPRCSSYWLRRDPSPPETMLRQF